MARLPVVTHDKADERTQQTYDAIKSKFGMVPNIFKGMANSSVALNAYLKLDEVIAGGNFAPVEQDIASDSDLDAFKKAGFTDIHVVEITVTLLKKPCQTISTTLTIRIWTCLILRLYSVRPETGKFPYGNKHVWRECAAPKFIQE